MKPSKKVIFIIIEIIFVFLLILTLILIYKNRREKVNDESLVIYDDPIATLSENENESIFVAMYPLTNYNSEDIKEILGVDTTIVNAPAAKLSDLAKYLDTAITYNPDITNIFLGIDLYKTYKNTVKEYEKYIFRFIESNPGIKFWIYPACPSIDYQIKFYEDNDLNKVLSSQQEICRSLVSYDNVFLSYIYSEEWLTANRLNYESNGLSLTSQAATTLLWNSFLSQLTPDNIDDVFEDNYKLAAKYQHGRPQYVDLSDSYCMFICDSVIALNTTTTSVPNVMSSLTGATCIPVSIGGTTAAFRADDFPHLTEMVNSVMNNQPLDYVEAAFYNSNLKNVDNTLLNSFAGNQFYIIIDMCLNDYFLGVPVGDSDTDDIRTYRGALTSNVRTLKNAYPNATIVLMSPYHIPGHNGGTDSMIETGETLSDYVDIMREIAFKEGAEFIDLFNTFNQDGELGLTYLISDQVHPSNLGCFKLAESMASELGKLR